MGNSRQITKGIHVAARIITSETETFKDNIKSLPIKNLRRAQNEIKINPGVGNVVSSEEDDDALCVHQSNGIAIYYLLKINSKTIDESFESIEDIVVIFISASIHKDMIDNDILGAIKFLLRALRIIPF
jgi:hypothetical protein